MHHFKLLLVFLLVLTAWSAHTQDPVSAEEFSQRGIARFEKNELEGAIADFTKVIELNGRQLEFCYYFRGIALYRLGRLDEAIADLSKAITLKQHPRFFGDRGNLLAQKGDLPGALADLNRAIELQPKSAKFYGDRGLVHLMRDEDAIAELDFRECFALNKALESQVKAAAHHIRQEAVMRAEHQTPADVEVVKFSWKEAPSHVLNPPSSSAVPVTTTPVSRTGLRVLGGPEKGEPGPRVSGNDAGIDPFDPLSPGPIPRPRATTLRGIDYKFVASIKNTGGKTITSVKWAYSFVQQVPREGVAYVFITRTNIPPGKQKELRDQLPSMVISATRSKAPSAHNREFFQERVVILRLDYADGSSWQSSRSK